MISSSPDGFIIILALAAMVGLIVFGPWLSKRLTDPINDALNNADKQRTKQREGDNLDYVANHFRDVGLPPDLKAAIDKVPNRPPLPGDRNGVVGVPRDGAHASAAQHTAAPASSPRRQTVPAPVTFSSSMTPAAPATSTPSVTPSFCRRCGQKLNKDVKFCPKCGNPILKNPTGPAATETGMGQARDAGTHRG